MTNKQIDKLAKKALKNGFESKPAKGMMYLKDLPVGRMFTTSSGTRGVLIESGVNARVVILSVKLSEEEHPYYLGKKNIAAETEIIKQK